VCGVCCTLSDMSPIAVEKGFTEAYIQRPNRKKLVDKIRASFSICAKGSDLVIIEGTGHAGVGSVFDLSNASVAKILGSKVILVTEGGVGRPIDEIMLNAALFEKMGVPLIGAIINKVLPDKYQKVEALVRRGLERNGIRLLGALPYNRLLSIPSVEQIREILQAEVIWGRDQLDNLADNIIVAAMEPRDVMGYLKERVLVITPGDREDVMRSILRSQLRKGKKDFDVVGMILSGGIVPHGEVMAMIRRTDIPILISGEDTYRVAARVHDRIIKIRPEDTQKVRLAIELIKRYVDIDLLIRSI